MSGTEPVGPATASGPGAADGGSGGELPDGVVMSDGREKSPRRGMCAAVLSLEAIALGLATPVMITVSHVAHATALVIGLGLAVVSVLIAGMLRRQWAYYLGWALQVAAVALGVVITTMFFLGAIFALLWASADLLGRKIDRERAAAYARFDAESEAAG